MAGGGGGDNGDISFLELQIEFVFENIVSFSVQYYFIYQITFIYECVCACVCVHIPSRKTASQRGIEWFHHIQMDLDRSRVQYTEQNNRTPHVFYTFTHTIYIAFTNPYTKHTNDKSNLLLACASSCTRYVFFHTFFN